jgi:8-oxo-dGTP diphosphatase
MQGPPNLLELYKFCPQCGKNLTAKQLDREKVKICEHCGFTFWYKAKPVVSLILHEDDKVLLIERAKEPFKGYWVLPGGFTSYWETAEVAIKREAEEEVGAEIKLEKIIGTYLVDMDPRGLHLDIVFAGTTKNKVKISKEDMNWHYFAFDELPELVAYTHKEAITDWFKKGSKYG